MKGGKLLLIFITLAALSGLSGTGYFYYQYQAQLKNNYILNASLTEVKKPEATAPATLKTPASSSATLSATRSAQVKTILRNGTAKVGLTAKIEEQLKKPFPQITVIDKENAAKNDYDRTVVVAFTETAKKVAQDLAKNLKGSVESLPAGEEKPEDIDLLVILGKNKTS